LDVVCAKFERERERERREQERERERREREREIKEGGLPGDPNVPWEDE
jgi:hypothetical protein